MDVTIYRSNINVTVATNDSDIKFNYMNIFCLKLCTQPQNNNKHIQLTSKLEPSSHKWITTMIKQTWKYNY